MLQATSHGLIAFLEKLELRVPLSDADREGVLGLPQDNRTLRRYDFIARDKQVVRDCCVLTSGFAIRHKLAGNGMRQIFSMNMKGDAVDLQNSLLGTADHNLQMLSEGEATFIPVDAIRSLTLAFPAVGQAMWYETLAEAAIFREWTLNIGRRSARSRTSHLLCEIAVRLERAGLKELSHFELPLTQVELGDALALTPVHISRTFKALASDEILSRIGRSIEILDWHALQKLGDFDPSYLHLNKSF